MSNKDHFKPIDILGILTEYYREIKKQKSKEASSNEPAYGMYVLGFNMLFFSFNKNPDDTQQVLATGPLFSKSTASLNELVAENQSTLKLPYTPLNIKPQ